MDYFSKSGNQKYSADPSEIPDSRSDFTTTSYLKKTSEPFAFQSDNIDDLKAGTANILVAVRCRPLSQKESSISDVETIGQVEDRVVVLREPPPENDTRESSRGPKREKNFTFDHFFDQKVSNYMIFERCTKNLIPGVLGGFNGTVFAYGATGAGKTYTMMGSTNNPGIMSYTLQELFAQIALNKQEGRKLDAKISFFEVYNETIIDLLGDKNSNLDIREDSGKGVYILGITEYSATSEEEVMRYLKIGTKNRTMEATSANEVSSRSHAILQVSVECKSRNEGSSQEINYSKLSLIDLAGSERAAATRNTGIRLTEGANINKSLLALSNCITMLVEKLDKGLKSIFVPYRDSKLTRLLKDSLGGNCRTVMIANVSPSSISYDDTNNTLKFADKAKKIKTNLKRKVVLIESDHDKYTRIINQLQTENENLRKLLKEQQCNVIKLFHQLVNNTIYSQFGQRQFSSNSGTMFEAPPPFRSNEAMIQEIQSHFEQEMRTNKKLFELEIIHDEYFLKIKDITQELGRQENLELRDELSHLITFQRNVLLQIKTARQEADIMEGRRDKLLKKITEDGNKPFMENGLALYNQLHSFLDDMKLDHQEKRIKYQTKLNGTQQDFIRSQMTGFFHRSPQTVSQNFFSADRDRTASIDIYRNQTPPPELEKHRTRNYNIDQPPQRKTLTPPPMSRLSPRLSPTHSPEGRIYGRPLLTDRAGAVKKSTGNVKPTPPPSRPKSKTKKAPPKSSGGNGYYLSEKFMKGIVKNFCNLVERFKAFEPQNKPLEPQNKAPKIKRPGRKAGSIEGSKSRTPLESHSNNVEKNFAPISMRDFDGSMELIGPPINYNNLIAKISLGHATKIINYKNQTSDNSDVSYSTNEAKQRLPMIGQRSPTKLTKYDY